MKYMAHLDGWRGMAIAAVLVGHFAPLPGVAEARLGVDLFFVLSGLLMSRILFEEQTPLSTFYRRRVSRILPVFLLYLVVIFGVSAALGNAVSFSEATATATFLRTYVGGVHIWDSVFPIGHIWSLNVEEHSYVALALIAALPIIRTGKGCLLLAIAAGLWLITAWYWGHPGVVQNYSIRTECAALPLLLSAGYRQVRQYFAPLVWPWMAPVALVAGVFCYTQFAPTYAAPFVAPFLLAFAVNHIGESRSRWIFERSWIRTLGLWSFSVYLWQQPFYKLSESGHLHELVALGLAMGVGLASYYWFESPVRRWLNSSWGAAPQSAAPASV